MKDDNQNTGSNIALADAIVSVSSALEGSNKNIADAIESSSKHTAGAIESSNRHIASAIHSSDKKIADALTSVAEVIDKDERSREKEVRMVFWLGVLLPVVTFLGVVLTVWSSYKMEANRESLQRNYQEAQLLQVKLDKARHTADMFNQALVDFRIFRDNTFYLCKNGVYSGNKRELASKHKEKIYGLVKIYFSMKRDFSDKIYKETLHLIDTLDNENMCSRQALSSDELREQSSQLNDAIDTFLKKQENEIMNLKRSSKNNLTIHTRKLA